MAIRPDKNVLNEHAKFNKFDKYKAEQKPDVTKVVDISGKDIATGKTQKRALETYTLSELKDMGLVNPTLTEDELTRLKEGTVKEPTGQFKKS